MNKYSEQKLNKRNKNTAKQNERDQRNIWHK